MNLITGVLIVVMPCSELGRKLAAYHADIAVRAMRLRETE
jgi:hypothetical protein